MLKVGALELEKDAVGVGVAVAVTLPDNVTVLGVWLPPLRLRERVGVAERVRETEVSERVADGLDVWVGLRPGFFSTPLGWGWRGWGVGRKSGHQKTFPKIFLALRTETHTWTSGPRTLRGGCPS